MAAQRARSGLWDVRSMEGLGVTAWVRKRCDFIRLKDEVINRFLYSARARTSGDQRGGSDGNNRDDLWRTVLL